MNRKTKNETSQETMSPENTTTEASHPPAGQICGAASYSPFTLSDKLHPASCAWWVTCSPHEWTWTQEEQEVMARAVVEMSGRTERALSAFCGEKSDGDAASKMFRILSEANTEPS